MPQSRSKAGLGYQNTKREEKKNEKKKEHLKEHWCTTKEILNERYHFRMDSRNTNTLVEW